MPRRNLARGQMTRRARVLPDVHGDPDTVVVDFSPFTDSDERITQLACVLSRAAEDELRQAAKRAGKEWVR